jgi:hypothetical protein
VLTPDTCEHCPMTRRRPAVVLLLLATACSSGSHAKDVVQAPMSSPSLTGTPAAAAAPTTAVPIPVAVPTTKEPAVRPSPTYSPRPPTPSPTPADKRPAATVVVINHASMAVDGAVGDYHFHLGSGQTSARTTFHPDAGGNTGVEVHRSDVASCGEGGPKYLKVGVRYTFTVTDTNPCSPQGKSIPGPGMTFMPH